MRSLAEAEAQPRETERVQVCECVCVCLCLSMSVLRLRFHMYMTLGVHLLHVDTLRCTHVYYTGLQFLTEEGGFECMSTRERWLDC